MMGYKDMTFCEQSTCKHFSVCSRAFTNEVREDATKWWGNPNFPIALFVDVPSCYEKGEYK